MADVVYPRGHPRSGLGPVFAFAVRTDAGAILVDTGIGPAHPLIDRLYRPQRISIDAALAKAGLFADDVIMIINTHLHFDHAGWNSRFPEIPIVVQLAEREAAQAPGYTVREWIDFPGAQYDAVAGVAEVAPGVTVFPTFGHTPGHQSVAVRTGTEVVVIAGQAVETAQEFGAAAVAVSLGRVAAVSEGVGHILDRAPNIVYFSHDRASWAPPQ